MDIKKLPASAVYNVVHKEVGRIFGAVLYDYFKILDTTPAPTVCPPSRIANLKPSFIAIG